MPIPTRTGLRSGTFGRPVSEPKKRGAQPANQNAKRGRLVRVAVSVKPEAAAEFQALSREKQQAVVVAGLTAIRR
jgi:hypothetical protein